MSTCKGGFQQAGVNVSVPKSPGQVLQTVRGAGAAGERLEPARPG